MEGEEDCGQLLPLKLAPNFEMAMYLAQATGSCLITDNSFRWAEIKKAVLQPLETPVLGQLANSLKSSSFAFPQNPIDIGALKFDGKFDRYPAMMRDAFKYLLKSGERGPKPNFESQLNARFGRTHAKAQSAVKSAQLFVKRGRVTGLFPPGGIQDNTVNRLLLMSSSEKHLRKVPMAFFLEELGADNGRLNARYDASSSMKSFSLSHLKSCRP